MSGAPRPWGRVPRLSSSVACCRNYRTPTDVMCYWYHEGDDRKAVPSAELPAAWATLSGQGGQMFGILSRVFVWPSPEVHRAQ